MTEAITNPVLDRFDLSGNLVANIIDNELHHW